MNSDINEFIVAKHGGEEDSLDTPQNIEPTMEDNVFGGCGVIDDALNPFSGGAGDDDTTKKPETPEQKKKKKMMIMVGVGVLVVIVLLIIVYFPRKKSKFENGEIDPLTKCGWQCYVKAGCPHCDNQKNLLSRMYPSFTNFINDSNTVAVPTWRNTITGQEKIGFQSEAQIKAMASC